MSERLSIIIPTLNESGNLPALIKALWEQSQPPVEIIVADAGSTDGTPELAMAAEAIVTPGGMPAAGRNTGAREASGDLLLFLDADVQPPPGFIAAMLSEFSSRGLGAATCLMEPISERASDWLICDITNLYLQLIQYVSPHAPGFCILVKRSIHNAISGFDESVLMAEDHDYVQRAAHYGQFGVLTGVRIPVSVRRLEKEGLVRLAFKYLYCELHALAGRPIRSMPFEYEFGEYTRSQARRFVDVAWLRQKLSNIENPLSILSDRGRSSLQALGSFQLSDEGFEQRLRNLLPTDLSALRAYLNERKSLLRLSTDPIRSTWKYVRGKYPFESIRLLDVDWKRLFHGDDAQDNSIDKS